MGKGSSGGGGTVVQGPSPEAARIAGEFQIEAAKLAAEAAKENTELGIGELRRQTEIGRADLAPQRLAGAGALDQLMTSLGLATPTIGSAAVSDAMSRNADLVNQQGGAGGGGSQEQQFRTITENAPGFLTPGGRLTQDALGSIISGFGGGPAGNISGALQGMQFDEGTSAEDAIRQIWTNGGVGGAANIGSSNSTNLGMAALSDPQNHARILEALNGLSTQTTRQEAIPFEPSAGGSGDSGNPLMGISDFNMINSDPSDLFEMIRNTPGFQFQMDEGSKSLQRNAAARGSLNSGNTLRELQTFGQNVASSQFGDYQNRLAQVAGLGGGASGQSAGLSGALGGNVAGQFGNLGNTLANAQLATGQARASSHLAANQQYQTIGGGGGGGGFGGLGSVLGGIGSIKAACARKYKENFEEISDAEVLERLTDLLVEKWNYKEDANKHISPYAEDFKEAFGVGDGDSIHFMDILGVALSSIKALSAKVKELEAK